MSAVTDRLTAENIRALARAVLAIREQHQRAAEVRQGQQQGEGCPAGSGGDHEG